MDCYPLTKHYPFSQPLRGDVINYDWESDFLSMDRIIHTEKLNGSNLRITEYGVLDKNGMPVTDESASKVYDKWESIRKDIKSIEIYVENLEAVRSIEYYEIEKYFYVFGMKCKDAWLSWDAVRFYATFYDLIVVPEITQMINFSGDFNQYERIISSLGSTRSRLTSFVPFTTDYCKMEGIISRNYKEFSNDRFTSNVIQFSRNDLDPPNLDSWQKAVLKQNRS